MTYIASTEPGVALFKVESLQCQVYLNPTHMQSLHIKVSPLPNDGKQTIQWSPEELQVIEQFFDSRVAAPPYRPSALCGFGKTLNLPPIVLKDAVQLMRLDLQPELMPGAKWNLQFCMRVPPSASPPIVPVGNPGVLTCREKILFFVSVTHHYFRKKSAYLYVDVVLICDILVATDSHSLHASNGSKRCDNTGASIGSCSYEKSDAAGEQRKCIVAYSACSERASEAIF